MPSSDRESGTPTWTRLGRNGRGLGFLFWCAFLLALEPGNLARALRAGETLTWSGEGARIIGAGLLGSAAAPFMVRLVRQRPVRRRQPMHVLWHLAAISVLAFALVTVAHLLAAVLLDGPPFSAEALGRDLYSNLTLVAFCLLAFDALLHAVTRPSQEPARTVEPSVRPQLRAVGSPVFEVQSRGALHRITADEIDWIEAQGNYVALHVGRDCHLIRGTLTSLEVQLGSDIFIRAHRSALVSLRRVSGVRRLPSGDAVALLTSGCEVRVSRTYAAALKTRLLES